METLGTVRLASHEATWNPSTNSQIRHHIEFGDVRWWMELTAGRLCNAGIKACEQKDVGLDVSSDNTWAVLLLYHPKHKLGCSDKGHFPLLLQEAARLLSSRVQKNHRMPHAPQEWNLQGQGDAMSPLRKTIPMMMVGTEPAVLM